MNKENKSIFERELVKALKEINIPDLSLSVLKGVTMKFRHNGGVVAELELQYIVKADSYILNGRVFGGPIFDCSYRSDVPYKSNLLSSACFSFTTSGRQDKKFSDNIYGSIQALAPNENEATCEKIKNSLESHYIPLVTKCIFPSKQTIDDVLQSPMDYAYPALLIHCAIKLGGIELDKTKFEEILGSKKIIKNKSYDAPLFTELS